jgi:hypothetical protein
MAFRVCARVINVSYDGRGQRAALRAVSFPGDTMQFVIAIAHGLSRRSGLVGCGRSLLQQIAVSIVRVRDRPRLRIVGRKQPRERVIANCAGAPLRAV